MSKVAAESPFCAVCQEDFPVAGKNDPIRMGLLFPLTRWRADSKLRRRVEQNRFGIGEYLCGNDYFNLTDEDR